MKRCVLILAFVLSGCAAGGGSATPQAVDLIVPGVPSPLEIELRALSKDGRSTYYKLHRDGTLEFGGGGDAIVRASKPCGTVTAAQAQQLWAIVQNRKLLDAKGRMFAKSEKVSYEARFRAGEVSAGYSTVDQEVPGLDELDAALFKMQAAMRYKDVLTPLDIKLQEQRERKEAEKAKGP